MVWRCGRRQKVDMTRTPQTTQNVREKSKVWNKCVLLLHGWQRAEMFMIIGLTTEQAALPAAGCGWWKWNEEDVHWWTLWKRHRSPDQEIPGLDKPDRTKRGNTLNKGLVLVRAGCNQFSIACSVSDQIQMWGVYQHVLIDEEGISWNFLKLLVREVRLAVRDEITDLVLPAVIKNTNLKRRNHADQEEDFPSDPPGDRELDEVQQVLSTVTNRAGFVAVASATQTPEEGKNRFTVSHRLILLKEWIRSRRRRMRKKWPLTSCGLDRDRKCTVCSWLDRGRDRKDNASDDWPERWSQDFFTKQTLFYYKTDDFSLSVNTKYCFLY